MLMSFGDSSKEKVAAYIKESKELGIQIEGPNINLSSTNFVIDNKSIIFSLTSITGLGKETAKKIISIRQQQENQVFTSAVKALAILSNNGVSNKILESLIKVGAFDCLDNRRQFLLANMDKITNSKLNLIDKNGNFLFDLDLNEEVTEDKTLYFDYEYKLLGVSFVKNPQIEKFDQYAKRLGLIHLEDNQNSTCKSLVEVTNVIASQTTKGKPMLKWNVVEDNKPYVLYSFDNVDDLKQKAEGYKYLVVDLKTYRDTYLILDIVKGEN